MNLRIAFLALSITWPCLAIADTSLVVTKDTDALSAAKKDAPVVQKLAKDKVINASARDGMYWHIKLDDGKEAFVSVLSVRQHSTDAGLSDALRSAVQNKRDEKDSANARERSAVMGVRGLDESSDTKFAGNIRPNLRAVYTMEKFLVSQASVQKLEDEVHAEIEKKLAN